MKVLAKDLKIVDTLCEFLEEEHIRDPDDGDKRVHWLLATIYFISWNLQGSRFNGRLIDNGFIPKLLQIAPKLKEEDPQFWTFMILNRVIRCSFKSSAYAERSIFIKDAIFSKMAMFIDIAEKANFKTLLVRRATELFINYLNTEEWQYYKSTVRSLLQDGTIFRVTKMFSDMSHDRQFIDMYINLLVVAFSYISTCVEYTPYRNKLQQVEMRLLNRMAIKHFPTLSKDLSGYALRNTACTIRKLVRLGDKEDIRFFTENKVFKKMSAVFVSELGSKNADYSKLTDIIMCLVAVGPSSPMIQNQDPMSLKDVRVILPHLPDMVDCKKHTAALAPFLQNRILLASNIITSENLLKDEHFTQLKSANILALLVETATVYHGKNPMVEQLAMTLLMWCIAPQELTCRLTLEEIDQILPVIPLCMEVLTGKDELISLHSVTPICGFLVTNLSRIKEDRTCSIGPQLDYLKKSNFVSGVCQGLIRTDISAIIFQLMYVLNRFEELFDNREFMKELVDLLPELAEKQHRFLEVGDSFEQSQAFMSVCVSIMKKAAAYVLDYLDPAFVEDVIADQAIAGWINFRISGDRMFFSSDCFETEENFEQLDLSDESFIDTLRATWCLIDKYPELVNEKLPAVPNLLFIAHPPDKDITALTSTRIIQTIISYLDHSQNKSLSFLTELTAFVKDLSHDSVSSEKNKVLFRDLMPACKRFLEVNSNKVFVENLKHFIDVNQGVLCDGYILD